MTLYALTTTTGIDAVGPLPRAARRLDTGQWVTPPPDGWTAALAAACGWLPVVESPRPADTATDTHEPTYTVDGATVTQSWTPRPWTADELAAQAEQAAYEAQQATDRAILDATASLMTDAHTDGQPWVQPTAAHDSYPLGITVTHGGKTWENLTPANVWQPGVSGWRELVAEGYPAWTQPTGGHDAYKVGDRVTFEGSDYESLIAGNVWSPTAYPQGWRKL